MVYRWILNNLNYFQNNGCRNFGNVIAMAFLLTSIGSQISRKVVFDEGVNKWLE